MSPKPTPDRKCAVAGCRSWAVRDQPYCASHLRQWENNVRLGLADPSPRLIGRDRRYCQIRSCKRLALPNSPYCAFHAEEGKQETANAEIIASQFKALLDRLGTPSPADGLDVLERELHMLNAARQILIAHAESASRNGWKGISAMTFMRLWLSSATTATDLAKARFVMENADGGGLDRLLSGVYARIEQSPPPAQEPLPGMLPPPSETPLSQGRPPRRTGQGSGVGAATTFTTPEAQLSEWLVEANLTLGTDALQNVLRAAAREDAFDQPTIDQLHGLVQGLPFRAPDHPLTPAELGVRLSALTGIIDLAPDLSAVRDRLWPEEAPNG